jgi:hypothetical protein
MFAPVSAELRKKACLKVMLLELTCFNPKTPYLMSGLRLNLPDIRRPLSLVISIAKPGIDVCDGGGYAEECAFDGGGLKSGAQNLILREGIQAF